MAADALIRLRRRTAPGRLRTGNRRKTSGKKSDSKSEKARHSQFGGWCENGAL